MGKTHKPYPVAFRGQIVVLVRAGRSPYDLAREFELSVEAIRSWVTQADRDEGRGRRDDPLPTTAEGEELNRV